MKILETFRSHFIREVLIPLVLVLLIIFTAATFTVWWATAKTNRDAAHQQQQIIETSLTQSLTEMIKQNRSLALWQPLGRRLDRALQDTPWLNQNVGTWLSTMFGHQLIYILDEEDRPVYRWEWDKNVPVVQFEHLRQPLHELSARLKTPFASGGHAEAIDFTLIDKRPAALAISVIDDGYGGSGRFRLVSVKYLDASYLNSLSQRSLLHDLHYADGKPMKTGANYLLKIASATRWAISAGVRPRPARKCFRLSARSGWQWC